jgi:long-chain acyl-CoA synthetase
MEKYLAEVEGPRQAAGGVPSASPVYRAAGSKDSFPRLGEISTLYELFTQSVSKYGDLDCLGSRSIGPDGKAGPFVFRTYKQVC